MKNLDAAFGGSNISCEALSSEESAFLQGGVSVPDSTSERCFNRFNPGMCGGRREDRQNIDGPSTEFIAFIFTLLELQSPYFTA